MFKYLDGKMSKGFVALLSSRSILFVVSGLLGVFAPIFVYELFGESLQWSVLFFGFASFIFFIVLSFGVKFIDKIGFKKSLQTSAFFGAAYYLVFFFADKELINVSYFVILSLLLLTLYRITYWVPYHTEFAKFSDHLNRGREVSLFSAIAMMVGIFLPLLSAFMINKFGYDSVFLIAIGLFVLSVVPYKFMPETNDKYTWTCKRAWKEFFYHKNSKMAISFMAQGGENVIGLYLWPIFLYQIFDGNLLDVGTVSTLIIAGTVILQLVVGKVIDKFGKGSGLLKMGSVLYAFGWLFKVFVITALEVFVVGVYHSISKIFTATPIQSITYDMSSEQDDYIDEYNVLKEMYVNAGRFIISLVVVALSFFVAIKWLFLVGALLALIFHLISENDIDLKKCP